MTKIRSFLVYFTLSYLVVGLILVVLIYGNHAGEIVAEGHKLLKGNFQAVLGSVFAVSAIIGTGKILRKFLNWFVN